MEYINHWPKEKFAQLLKTQQVNSIEVAGEGNMNFTYRLKLDSEKSLIIKQSPPFCAKFPQIPAPPERIYSEQTYYQEVAKTPSLSKHSPSLVGFYPEEKILLMSDLGAGSDFENIYFGESIEEDDLKIIINYLSLLHQNKSLLNFKNMSMRELNHAYIFNYPYEANKEVIDLDTITPGLQEISQQIAQNLKLKEIITQLGKIYLQEGDRLIHGDYYPRSWLRTPKGIFVIDPEFAFVGMAEFDTGIFLAHMALSNNLEKAQLFLKSYYKPHESFSWDLHYQFCCVEILRRLLFVAQVPVKNELNFKKALVEMSVSYLLGKNHELKI